MDQIYMYQPRTEQDVLLAGWWKFLRDSNELHKLFPADQHALSSFLASFAKPVELVYQLNDGGEVCRAAWFSPSMQVGAEGGMWIHPDLRASKDSYAFVLRCLEVALDTWGVIFGITKQPALLDAHIQLGYTVSEELPSAWDGESAWIVLLTKRAFQEARHGGSKSSRKPSREAAIRREPTVDEPDHPVHVAIDGPGDGPAQDRGDVVSLADAQHHDPSRQVSLLQGQAIDSGLDGEVPPGRYPLRTAHPRGPKHGRRVVHRERRPELLSMVLADRRERRGGSGEHRDERDEQRDGGGSEPDQSADTIAGPVQHRDDAGNHVSSTENHV